MTVGYKVIWNNRWGMCVIPATVEPLSHAEDCRLIRGAHQTLVIADNYLTYTIIFAKLISSFLFHLSTLPPHLYALVNLLINQESLAQIVRFPAA